MSYAVSNYAATLAAENIQLKQKIKTLEKKLEKLSSIKQIDAPRRDQLKKMYAEITDTMSIAGKC